MSISFISRARAQEKAELERKVQDLRRTEAEETLQLGSLQKKRQETTFLLALDKLTLQQVLQNALVQLKNKQPELFYITGTEQIAKLTAQFIHYLFS